MSLTSSHSTQGSPESPLQRARTLTPGRLSAFTPVASQKKQPPPQPSPINPSPPPNTPEVGYKAEEAARFQVLSQRNAEGEGPATRRSSLLTKNCSYSNGDSYNGQQQVFEPNSKKEPERFYRYGEGIYIFKNGDTIFSKNWHYGGLMVGTDVEIKLGGKEYKGHVSQSHPAQFRFITTVKTDSTNEDGTPIYTMSNLVWEPRKVNPPRLRLN